MKLNPKLSTIRSGCFRSCSNWPLGRSGWAVVAIALLLVGFHIGCNQCHEPSFERLEGSWVATQGSCEVFYNFDRVERETLVALACEFEGTLAVLFDYAEIDNGQFTLTNGQLIAATGLMRWGAGLANGVSEVAFFEFDDEGHLILADSSGTVSVLSRMTSPEANRWRSDFNAQFRAERDEDRPHCGNPDHNPGVADWEDYVCQNGREADGCLPYSRYTSHVRNACPGEHSLCCPPDAPVVEPEPRNREPSSTREVEPSLESIIQQIVTPAGAQDW